MPITQYLDNKTTRRPTLPHARSIRYLRAYEAVARLSHNGIFRGHPAEYWRMKAEESERSERSERAENPLCIPLATTEDSVECPAADKIQDDPDQAAEAAEAAEATHAERM